MSDNISVMPFVNEPYNTETYQLSVRYVENRARRQRKRMIRNFLRNTCACFMLSGLVAFTTLFCTGTYIINHQQVRTTADGYVITIFDEDYLYDFNEEDLPIENKYNEYDFSNK